MDYRKGTSYKKFLCACGEGEIKAALNKASAVVVGLSGGADSTLLLYYMKLFADENSLSVGACHLNHMLRGQEADRDELSAKMFAAKLGVPYYSEKIDVSAFAKDKKIGTEEAARIVRYQMYERAVMALFPKLTLSISDNADVKKVLIATAHTADDNLETVIFNLSRGSGGTGVAGIPPVRDGIYIRPIRYLTSKEVREECRKLSLDFCVDSTNELSIYTRNRIRQNIIPEIKKINPGAAEAVSRSGDIIRRDECFIRNYAESVLGKWLGTGRAPVELLSGMDDSPLSRAVMMLTENKDKKSSGGLEYVHIQNIISLIRRGGKWSQDIPGGKIYSDGKIVCFGENIPENNVEIKNYSVEMEIPDLEGRTEYYIPEIDIIIILASGMGCKECVNNELERESNIYKLFIHKAIRFDKINKKIFLRQRRAGDRIRYGGLSRLVKKLYSEKKLSQLERAALPVFLSGEDIFFIPGFPVADGYSVSEKEILSVEQPFLHIYIYNREESIDV